MKAETGGAGVDLILDAIGGSVFDAGFPVLAAFGRYVIYGQASDGTAAATTAGRAAPRTGSSNRAPRPGASS